MSRGRRILLVDDDEDFLLLAGIWLSEAGFEVVEAADWRRAFEAVDKKRVDLLLLDIEMPEMDGFQLLQRLRDRGHRIPAVFVSSHQSQKDRAEAMGIVRFLPKPVSPRELVEAVNGII